MRAFSMPRRGSWFGLLLPIGFLSSLQAQTIQPRRGPIGSGCTFDTAAVRDTVLYTLVLTPGDPADSVRLWPVLRGVAATFVPPGRVSTPRWPGTWIAEPDTSREAKDARARGVGPFTGDLRIEVDKGRVTHAGWRLPPDSPELLTAVLEAVHRADSVRGASGRTFFPGRRRTTLRLALRTATKSEPLSGVPILQLRMPVIRVEQPVVMTHVPMPVFPAHLQKRGAKATVDLQYVVTEDGRASPTSIRILEADDSAFAISAREAIVAGRFAPARTRGCAVQLLVQQRIRYRD